MPHPNDKDAQDLCLHLLQAETEDEVINILRDIGYWDNRSVWKPYGDIPNNRSIVGVQQSSSVAALVEKLVNSIDAVLTAECFRKHVDPTSPSAPSTMREAVQRFFGIRDGKISLLTPAERTRLAERIQLVACGTKENPAYMIVDDGEGQSPDQFPSTFLSLIRENKTRIPFVQGKFNMGGTGVLQFAGVNSFQLIISRRQPDIVFNSESPTARHWGFTLVRRLSPSAEQPQSMYVYLAPGGHILSFDADSLPLRPGRYPEAYAEHITAGTCIKIWNYKLPGRLKSLATLDLRYALEQHLQEPVLPIRVCERRPGYRAHYYDTTISGLSTVLSDKMDDVELESGSPMKVPNVGDVDIRFAVMKETIGKKKEDRYPAGIFFVVNGQLHSELSKDFLSRRTKFDYIADTLITIVDCTGLPQLVREDLFMTDRERMRQCYEREALETAVIDYLREHPGLRELNARRRQERLAATSEQDTAEVLQNLVKADPTLAQLFGRGKQIKVPVGPIPTPVPFEGLKFPTYFRIHNEPKDGLVKRCPHNWTCRIEYETDAANDYFTRLIDPGHLETRGSPSLVSRHLWNGKAILRFGLPQSANVGDRLRVNVDVSDVSRVDAISSHFIIEVEDDAPLPPPPHPPPPPGAQLAGIPNVREVWRDSWAQYAFNESSALSIRSGEDEGLDIFVNMDNIYLRNEVARRRDLDPALVSHRFKWGLVLLALGMLFQEKRDERATALEGEENEEDRATSTYTRIGRACEGVAITLIPVLLHLGQSGPVKP